MTEMTFILMLLFFFNILKQVIYWTAKIGMRSPFSTSLADQA